MWGPVFAFKVSTEEIPISEKANSVSTAQLSAAARSSFLREISVQGKEALGRLNDCKRSP